MFCTHCGKPIADNSKFCPECGTAVYNVTETNYQEPQYSEVENAIQSTLPVNGEPVNEVSEKNTAILEKGNKSKDSVASSTVKQGNFKKVLGVLAIVALAYFAITTIFGSKYNVEYTNNTGDKLPVIVTDITMYDAEWLDTTVVFDLKNLTNTDYKEATFVLFAWDADGYPINVDQPTVLSFEDCDYMEHLYCDIIRANETTSYEGNFDDNIRDAEYISVFLTEYIDFNGEKWESPVLDHLEEIRGKKLDTTETYYFTFSHESSTDSPSQKPVNSDILVGDWQDSWSERCCMSITSNSNNSYTAHVTWASSATQYDEWTFSGIYNAETGILEYYDGMWISHSDDGQGSIQEGIVLDNMEGLLLYENGILYWSDFTSMEYDCDFGSANMQFTKIS